MNVNDYLAPDSRYLHCGPCIDRLFEAGEPPAGTVIEVTSTGGLVIRCTRHVERPLFKADNRDVAYELFKMAGAQCPCCKTAAPPVPQ